MTKIVFFRKIINPFYNASFASARTDMATQQDDCVHVLWYLSALRQSLAEKDMYGLAAVDRITVCRKITTNRCV